MGKKAIPALAWFIPIAPLALAFAIYFGEFQSSSFLFLNQLAILLPDTLWAWLTFLGNGWGVFALAFPLLLLAPRALSAAVFAEEKEALAVAQQINAGAISINDAGLTALIHEGEKNSFKYSGLGGSRMGEAALRRFLRKKAFLVKTNSVADPWWF